LCFRSIEPQQQAVVEERRMIDAVVVANESVGDAAQFQQPIPIGIVPRQTGDLQSEDDAHVGQCDFAGEACKSGARVPAGTGKSEILVDDHHLFLRPSQLAGAIGQGVLTGSGLAIMLDLTGGGLANVHIGSALLMRWVDFGRITH
jgi:hypothetical protein